MPINILIACSIITTNILITTNIHFHVSNMKNFNFSSEFKKHPFFDGVDWEQVAKRASIPSYEPNDLQIDYDNAKELVELFQISEDDEENLDADLVDKFQCECLLENYIYLYQCFYFPCNSILFSRFFITCRFFICGSTTSKLKSIFKCAI